jgi:probable F420-dependent oxidoreductase
MMKLGISIPSTDFHGDPLAHRDFAQLAEGLGYHHAVVYDHVLGANPAKDPDFDGAYTAEHSFHDPFVLLAYLAGQTATIELSVQVLILAQRQTALVAKQAASLDVLSGGRLRLGVGIGWNEVEFIGLGENFANRGVRSEEQVAVMKALWSEPHVTFEGRWHHIPDAGINPLPLRRPLAVWFGGRHDNVLRRIARVGDGWMPLHIPAGEQARREIETLMGYVEAEGRARAEVGIDAWVSMGAGTAEGWRAEITGWRDLGATHITMNTAYQVNHHRRIKGRAYDDHAAAAREYMAAVGDLFEAPRAARPAPTTAR